MDPISLAASVIAVIGLAESCLKMSRKWLGPSMFGSEELKSMTTTLYGFSGIMRTFQTHLEIHDDDRPRLIILEHLAPALERCTAALQVIRGSMEDRGFIGKHLVGQQLDRKLKTSLKNLNDAKELFLLAVHADHQTILLEVERYIRSIGQDIRDLQIVAAEANTKLDDINADQNKHLQLAEDWHLETSTRLMGLHSNVDLARREIVDGKQANTAATASIQTSLDRQDALRHEEERRSILNWIAPAAYATQHKDIIDRRQDGTGEWFIQSPEYQNWITSEKQTLFSPGIPGAGKTLLTATVVEDLYSRFQHDSNIGMAYIYFNFRRQDEQRPEALLSSLLRQLTEKQVFVPESVINLYQKYQAPQNKPGLDEIIDVLLSAATLYSRIFLVVDALDECHEAGHRSSFLETIFKLQTHANGSVFATSRPIPDIEAHFNRASSLEISANKEDVDMYIDGHMSHLPGFVLRSPELCTMVKTEIAQAVEGMFLLAQLYLASLEDKTTVKAVKSALSQFKKQTRDSAEQSKTEILSKAYEYAMERIRSQKSGFRQLAEAVLSWIICSTAPLTALQLQHALAIEVGAHELDHDNIPEVEDMVSVCAGLVTVDKESNAIRLVHYTTQEYFERTLDHWFPAAQNDISVACVTYLSFTEFGYTFVQSQGKDYWSDAYYQDYPFYNYAAENWHLHTRASSCMHPCIIKFLETGPLLEVAWRPLLKSKTSRGVQLSGLYLSAYHGLSEAVATLIHRGHDVNAAPEGWSTALSVAAANGDITVVQILLACDKHVINAKAKYGHDPLWSAADAGHAAVVQVLLKCDQFDPNLRDSAGLSPLTNAARKGDASVVQVLLGCDKVDRDVRDRKGSTPLMYAARKARDSIVRILLGDAGVKIDSRDKYGQTALLCTAKIGKETTVQLLLEAGADASCMDEFGWTILSIACYRGWSDVVARLLTMDQVDRNARDGRGGTPLMYAARLRATDIISMLLDAGGIDIDVRDSRGATALMHAAKKGSPFYGVLLNAGAADIDSSDTSRVRDLLSLFLHPDGSCPPMTWEIYDFGQ